MTSRNLSRRDFLALLAGAPIAAATLAVQPREAQAARTAKVWAVSKITIKGMTTKNLSYTKAGLLKAVKSRSDYESYSYDTKGRMKSFQAGYLVGREKMPTSWGTCSCDDSGNLTKVKKESEYTGNATFVFVRNSKGRITQVKKNGKVAKSYAFNAKSHPKKDATYTYSYDGKANLKTRKRSGTTYSYKSTYNKKGLLISKVESYRSASGGSQTTTYIYTYRRMSVPKAYKKRIQLQQWALVNGTYAGVLPELQ